MSRNTYNNQQSISVGDINITQQPGQDSKQVAREVMNEISRVYDRGGQYGGRV